MRPGKIAPRLFYNLQVLGPAARFDIRPGLSPCPVSPVPWRRQATSQDPQARRMRTVPGLLREDAGDGDHRHRTSCDAPLKRAVNCTHRCRWSLARRATADVEDDLAVFHERGGHARLRVDLTARYGVRPLSAAPFADGADQIGLGGLFGHWERILHATGAKVGPNKVLPRKIRDRVRHSGSIAATLRV